MGRRKYQGIRAVILAELERRDMSQSELARRVGVHQSHVNAFLTGRRDVTTRTADRFLAALGLQISRRRSSCGYVRRKGKG